MYVITGATGHIGKILSEDLLSKGKQIRAIAHHNDKLQPLSERGAETFAGDMNDPIFVRKAFEGATAAFCMVPANPHSADLGRDQRRVVDNMLEAVKLHHVKHVVLLSSIGAHLIEGAGVVDGLAYMEVKFASLKNTNIVNLRCSYFMENLLGQISTIKNMGIAGTAIRGNLKMPMVATKDIAREAFMLLNGLAFSGNHIQYVLGPRDVTYDEVTSILGKAIGKPDLKYVQFSYEDAKKGMVDSGFASANVAELFNGLSKALNDGTALNFHTRTSENTTPTDIKEFAHFFAQAYQMV